MRTINVIAGTANNVTIPNNRPVSNSRFVMGRTSMVSPMRSLTSRCRMSKARKTIPNVKVSKVILPICEIAKCEPSTPAEAERYDANMCANDRNNHVNEPQITVAATITHVRASRLHDRISAQAIDQSLEILMYLRPYTTVWSA